VSFVPYLRGATAGYAFESGREPLAGAWGVGGAIVATEVSRRWGTVRHAVAPRLEWRAGTGLAGDGIPWLAYDALDRSSSGLLSAAPAGAWQQLRAAVETRLSSGGADLLRLEVGQDYDVGAGRFAETFAAAAVAWRRLSGDASARFFAVDGRPEGAKVPALPSAALDRFTELRANVSLADRRGDALRAGFIAVGPGGSGALLAGIDPLFDLSPARAGPTAAASAGARVVLGGATLGYDVLFPGRAARVSACVGDGERRVGAWQAQQHAASAAWSSPCRCFRLAATLRVNDCGEIAPSVSLDLGRLAEPRPAR